MLSPALIWLQNDTAPGVAVTPTFQFHDAALFPADLSYGTSGGPGWRTGIQYTRGGLETRTPRLPPEGQRTYRIERDFVGDDDAMQLLRFVLNRRGSAFGFRFQDWRDYTSHDDGRTTTSPITSTPVENRVLIAVGDGTETEFQIWKHYADAFGHQVVRKITRVQSTAKLAVWNNTTLQTNPTHYTVDIDTGLITFGTAPIDGAQVEVAFEFHVPVRFGASADEWVDAVQQGYEDTSFPGLTMLEILDHGEQIAPFEFGGYYDGGSFSGHHFLDPHQGLYQTWEPADGAARLHLWDPRFVEGGGPFMYIRNDSGAFTLQLLNSWNLIVGATLATKQTAEIYWDHENLAWRIW